MEFYESLSEKAKVKYLELWEPKIGQEAGYNTSKCVNLKSVIVHNSSDENTLIALVNYEKIEWVETKYLKPEASLELCFDMLEKMGFSVNSIFHNSRGYHTGMYKDKTRISYDSEEGKTTRLESLQEALKWALEKEVK